MNCFRIYRSKLYLLSTLIFLLTFFASVAQEYSYTHYDSKDGLAGSTVYCAKQDREGFLWFGTETGLSRFDGTHFKNFTTADGLPDNEILRVFVDSKNRVWIIPFKNSVCYYWKGKIYNQENDSSLKKLVLSGNVRAVLEDKEGNILIQENYLSHIIRPDGTIVSQKEIGGLFGGIADAGINEYGRFRVAFYHSDYLMFADFDDKKVRLFHRGKVTTKHTSLYLLTPAIDVFSDDQNLNFYPSGAVQKFSFPMPENFINMAELNDSLITLNASSKTMVFNWKQKKIIHEFLPGYKVTAVLEDKEKNIWFATMGEGIFRLGSTEFRNLHFRDKESSLSVFSICKYGSKICIGTDHSIVWTFDPRNYGIQKFKIGKDIEDCRVTSLITGPANEIFIGTDKGAYKSLSHTVNLQPYQIAVKGMIIRKDSLIAASAHGVNIVQTNIRLWAVRATCLHANDTGIYVGTLNGMYNVGRSGYVFLGKEHKLLSTRISAIAKTENGIYWIGTYGDGIVGYKNGKVVMNLREEHGLTSNICRNLVVSGDTLWAGTDKGLNKICFSGNDYRITKFTISDGLSSDIIHAVYVDSGMVYVGTPQGLTFFDENKINQNSKCHLHLTAIRVSANTWYDTTGFRLAPSDNNLRFEFVGISYRSAGDITYRYRLIGLDTNWKTTKESFLSYPSLPSGDYRLQLTAINKFGVSSFTKEVNFSIAEKLAEKTWFRLMILFAVILLIALVAILYTRRINKKAKEKINTLHKMAELEQMALRAQMNPHFIFNSLNSIQHYVIDKDIAGANKFITDFSSLIRQTLEFSSKPEVSLADELDYLSTYLALEKARMENKFIYEIRLSELVSPQDHYIPPMILQPFVENSVRHGIGFRKDELGKIRITINLTDQMLICVIEDNGVGRQLAGQFRNAAVLNHRSKGTSVTMARIDMLNLNNENKIRVQIDDLIDELAKAIGTRVTICFPVFNHATKSIV